MWVERILRWNVRYSSFYQNMQLPPWIDSWTVRMVWIFQAHQKYHFCTAAVTLDSVGQGKVIQSMSMERIIINQKAKWNEKNTNKAFLNLLRVWGMALVNVQDRAYVNFSVGGCSDHAEMLNKALCWLQIIQLLPRMGYSSSPLP